jgi:gliding motility-associated-like protein
LTLSIGIPDINILWSNGSSDASIVITDSIEVFATISNQCGQAIDSLSVLLLPETPPLDLGADQNICPGEVFILTPDIPDVTYLWQDGSTLPSFETMQGDTISLTITGTCGTSSDTLILTESNQGPQVNLGPDILACENETITIEAGISGVQYLWQDGSTSDQFITTQSGTFSVSVSNACGNDQDTLEVFFELNPPAQNLGPDSTLCDGQEMILTATNAAGLSLLWQDGQTDETYTVTPPGGLYVLTGSNRCGAETDSVQISFVNGPPPVDLGPDTVLCEGNSLLLSVIPGAYDIIWQDGNTIPEFVVSQTGVYTIQLINDCGIETDSIRVLVDTNVLQLNLPPQLLWCPGDNFILDATQPFDAAYLWNTGAVDPSIAASAPGQYSVEVSTFCYQESSLTEIMVQDGCSLSPLFYLPNIFTPDGNGVNDKFTLSTNLPQNILGIEGEIFDRWGNLVFASNDLPFEWEGSFNGAQLNPGVYVYVLVVTYLDNGETMAKQFSGDVTLVR